MYFVEGGDWTRKLWQPGRELPKCGESRSRWKLQGLELNNCRQLTAGPWSTYRLVQ